MQTVVEPLEGNKVKLSVKIEDQEFRHALDEAATRLAREVRMPGFRPGKVPRRVLEARLGTDALRAEALRGAVPEFYAEALKETALDAIAPPEIDITEGEESGPVAFDAVVQIRPVVAIPGYAGLQITMERPVASDEEIRRQIDRLRATDGKLTEVSRPAVDGDHVTINIHASRGGEAVDALSADDFLYEVGSAAVVPELDDHLRGSAVGAILEFTATLPGDEHLGFKVLVKEIKEMVLPDLTDSWASNASEFATVQELEGDLRTRIESVKRVQASMAVRDLALGALVELVADEAPQPLVASEVERRIHDLAHRLEHQGASLDRYIEATGQTPESLVEELRVAAAESVKADLALRALADAESIEATEEDVDEEIAKTAEAMSRSAAQVRKDLDRADRMGAVRSDVRKAKALAWLVDHVAVVDPEGRPIDRTELEPPALPDDPADPSDRPEAGASQPTERTAPGEDNPA